MIPEAKDNPNHMDSIGPVPSVKSPEDLRRRRKRTVILSFTGAILVLVLTFLELHFLKAKSVLVLGAFNFNLVILLLLALVILRNVVKGLYERRHKTPGMRLRSKLVVTFVGLTLIPTGVLFVAASGLISEALNNWFNPRIEGFLIGALDITQIYTQDAKERSMYHAHRMAEEMKKKRLLRGSETEKLLDFLHRTRIEQGIELIQVFSAGGDELARKSAEGFPDISMLATDSQFFRDVQEGKDFYRIDPVGKADIMRCGVPIQSSDSTKQIVGVLIIGSLIPESLARTVHKLSQDYTEYTAQRQAIFETKALYLTILLVLTLTIVFSATWLGFYLARIVTIPIECLVDATRRVQKGDLSFKMDVAAYDEVGLLVDSFNQMTDKLRSQREKLEEGHTELSHANKELEKQTTTISAILEGITSGVIGIDPDGLITTFNSAAGSFLQISPTNALGNPCRTVFNQGPLNPLANFIEQADRTRSRQLKEEIRISQNNRQRTFRITSNPLQNQDKYYTGMVIVLEDLTHILKIRRIGSWQEVARRIAHEIKNPLTPIQLSAQRLERRLDHKDGLSPELVRECTSTIVNQVDDLKSLVDSFSRFARMPEAKLESGDLNQLIRETLKLYAALEGRVEIITDLSPAFPLINFDPEQIRRLLQNLIDNSIEAMNVSGTVWIKTSYDLQAALATLEVSDNGPGVNPEEKERLFLPYFSTKRRGSGLGLAIVSRIVSDHGGFIRIKDNDPQGTTMLVELPVDTRYQETKATVEM